MRRFFPYFIAFACLSLFGGFSMAFFLKETKKPPQVPVKIIAQTGPQKEGLKTDYLAELLDLSYDRPKMMSCEEAKTLLEKSPVIKTVAVSLLGTDTFLIDYTLRRPKFLFLDVNNCALDEEGRFFPLAPFYTPKNLPELYLGLDTLPPLNTSLDETKMRIAKALAEKIGDPLMRIDLSHMSEPTLGKREIVVILRSHQNVHTLRLPTSGYEEQMERYFSLREKISDRTLTIDLRLSRLAYLQQL